MPGSRSNAPAQPAGDDEVRALWEEARAAYPDLELDEATFRGWISRATARGQLAKHASKPRAADLFLACACAVNRPGAIARFEQQCLAPARGALVRAGSTAADVDDALQILRERLLVGGHLRDFSGRGSLAGWTRVSLAHQLATLHRSRGRNAAREREETSQLVAIDPELALLRRRYSGAFRAAIADALGGLAAEQRTVLRLHFVDGVALEGIAAILRCSRATAGRRLKEARAALLEGAMVLVGQRLRANPSEVASLLRAVRSVLEVTLGELLPR